MSLEKLITPFPWQRYSKKLAKRIDHPRSGGFFSAANAKERGVRLVVGTEGTKPEGNMVSLYFFVDPADGIIIDAKFQTFGQSALIGAADAACDLIVGKNYDQAHRITADFLDQYLRDHPDQPAFPPETYPHLNLVLGAIENAMNQCIDIPLPEQYVAPPMTADLSEVIEGGYPGWEDLSEIQKISVIEAVLDKDVRPYIALDAGGVEVRKLNGPYNLSIRYKGTCTSCMSSVGATLSYIQQVMRNKVHPEIIVEPEL